MTADVCYVGLLRENSSGEEPEGTRDGADRARSARAEDAEHPDQFPQRERDDRTLRHDRTITADVHPHGCRVTQQTIGVRAPISLLPISAAVSPVGMTADSR